MIKPDIKAMFHELNKLHFSGEIPDIPVVWNTRMTTTAGYCRYLVSHGVLSPLSIDLSEKLFRNMDYDTSKVARTLTHEMVHAYLCYKFNEKGHTPRFQRMMINITGEYKNHRCHNYDTTGLKRRQIKKVRGECGKCDLTYHQARMPKHAEYSAYTHRGCGGEIAFSRIKQDNGSINIF